MQRAQLLQKRQIQNPLAGESGICLGYAFCLQQEDGALAQDAVFCCQNADVELARNA